MQVKVLAVLYEVFFILMTKVEVFFTVLMVKAEVFFIVLTTKIEEWKDDDGHWRLLLNPSMVFVTRGMSCKN